MWTHTRTHSEARRMCLSEFLILNKKKKGPGFEVNYQ